MRWGGGLRDRLLDLRVRLDLTGLLLRLLEYAEVLREEYRLEELFGE